MEAGFTKADVRALSRRLGLPSGEKPSMACYASRFPYNTLITREKLRQVAEAEALLFATGVRQARVRHHGDTARIEVPVESFGLLLDADTRPGLVAGIKALGFAYVTLDLQGFRSGSMNEVLTAAERGEG
jgi:pyridinium-3,5-biscarboxylic acid mononucleotide sulfurtransferase